MQRSGDDAILTSSPTEDQHKEKKEKNVEKKVKTMWAERRGRSVVDTT
jgi:hypothetical protein